MKKGQRRKPFEATARVCPRCGEVFVPTGPDRSRQKYCSRTCSQVGNAKAGTGVSGQRGVHRLKTGRLINKDGYVRVLVGDHPWPRKYHYMFEHVKVMEVQIGRRLRPNEVVHHINRNRKDNRLSNLQLMTREEHNKLHAEEQKQNT